MVIELPEELEIALKAQAEASRLSSDVYIRKVPERGVELGPVPERLPPFETGYGMWKKYGISLSEEDIDENRADMFRNFGEGFE